MQDHWTEVAPPAYITSAAAIGYKGSPPSGEAGDDMIQDPEQLQLALSSIPGGRMV